MTLLYVKAWKPKYNSKGYPELPEGTRGRSALLQHTYQAVISSRLKLARLPTLKSLPVCSTSSHPSAQEA